MYNDLYPLLYHTKQFYCPKNPPCSDNLSLRSLKTVAILIFFFKSSPDDIFSLLFRERGRERGQEREKHQCERETSIGCLPYVPGLGIVWAQTRDRTCNPGMCTDQELNLHFLAMEQCSDQMNHTSQGNADLLLSL